VKKLTFEVGSCGFKNKICNKEVRMGISQKKIYFTNKDVSAESHNVML